MISQLERAGRSRSPGALRLRRRAEWRRKPVSSLSRPRFTRPQRNPPPCGRGHGYGGLCGCGPRYQAGPMPMRLPRGWRMGTWMNRTLVIVVAVSVFCSIGLLADEIPSGFDPGSSKAKGLILTFEDWPPDGVETDPFLQKLHSAGLKVKRKLPRFRVWVFEWDEWQEGRRAGNLCIELLLDDRTSSLFGAHPRNVAPAVSGIGVRITQADGSGRIKGGYAYCRLSRTRFPWTQNWLNRSVQGGPEHGR